MNYFTCTLGHAQHRRQQRIDSATPFRTVLDVIDEQARHVPCVLALGFAAPTPECLTFDELCVHSKLAAGRLVSCVGTPQEDKPGLSIGLLCASSLDFVLTWLGLMRLGWSVLLLAPQLDPSAAQHLCATLGVNVILVDAGNLESAKRIQHGVEVVEIPSYSASEVNQSLSPNPSSSSDTAYFFHSSGTSSGLPKPISQTHFSAAGAPPRFQGEPGMMAATFTTTPLYHGGLADALRSWTAGASIWVFPEGLMPITSANVVRAVRTARSQSDVEYFSSVPYVLQRLAEDQQGLELLQSMAVVAFGGAALPISVGDGLVDAGVNLSSRFGSAESGFLMSSHRDYDVDKEWQYLRPVQDPHLLTFEPREDDLWELVVRAGWPVRAKINRPDGSYATSDLFQPHPWRPNLWRYHSRADSQIVLLNGKKFDPAPMEADILASTSLLRDVLIFGTGKDYPGVLLFPATTDEEIGGDVTDMIWPLIDGMNAATTASHSRITRPMVVVIHLPEDELPLEKSSKGSILRRQAEERYAQAIESSYHSTSPSSSPATRVSDDQVLPTVLNCFQRVLGRQIDPSEDLFRQGVDSIACIQIQNLLQSACITETKIPTNSLYDKGTIDRLVIYLHRLRNGGEYYESEKKKELDTMRHLADKYSDFAHLEVVPRERRDCCIVLTGATGFLGAQVLNQLLHNTKVKRVYCLVRASTQHKALERVSSSFSTLGLGSLDDGKVECIPCNISSTGLGLEEKHEKLLIRETTIIIHLAWAVNFNLHLDSFEHHIAGTRELIAMAVKCRSRFFFISSTAAVSHCSSTSISETLSEKASEASPLGYARSKWVTERICAAANEHLYRLGLGDCISIIRVGQLCGDKAGVWNASEAYPLMLSTASVAGCLPDLPGECLNWLPVELAARAVIEICLQTTATFDEPETTRSETRVYHVVDPSCAPPTWKQLLGWISEDQDGPSFEIVSPETWLLRLEQALKDGQSNHPAVALLGLWRDSYCRDDKEDKVVCPRFSVDQSRQLSATMRAVEPLDRDRLIRIWRWICTRVGIAESTR